jgi:hypothetical protein
MTATRPERAALAVMLTGTGGIDMVVNWQHGWLLAVIPSLGAAVATRLVSTRKAGEQ